MDIPCPECRGSRYSKAAEEIYYTNPNEKERYSLPQLMAMDVQYGDACPAMDMKTRTASDWNVLQHLGLGYLTLGEETPSLSGGEAQRLKLAERDGQRTG